MARPIESASVSGGQQCPPAFVISLDFELHWGVSERVDRRDHPYMANLRGTPEIVERMLELFTQRRVHATWATVGALMADGRQDLEPFLPDLRPAYEREAVDTYRLELGDSEQDDPIHFAPSLVEKICSTPGQEFATHTFSHYYCGEPGQDVSAFSEDLQAAQRIADRSGAVARSLVFPRNQVFPSYLPALPPAGIDVYRGNPSKGLIGRQVSNALSRIGLRLLRLADGFFDLTGQHTLPWSRVNEGQLSNVAASQFFRPYSRKLRLLEPLRRRRIKNGIRAAARKGEIFHLWWHPHNFGVNQEENMAALADILDEFEIHRDSHGMESMTMAEVADRARFGDSSGHSS